MFASQTCCCLDNGGTSFLNYYTSQYSRQQKKMFGPKYISFLHYNYDHRNFDSFINIVNPKDMKQYRGYFSKELPNDYGIKFFLLSEFTIQKNLV